MTTGSESLSATDPAGGVAGGGTGGGTAAPAAGPTGGAPPPPAAEGWLADMPDELRSFVGANGWKSPADVVTNTRELQRYLGADKAGRGLVLPGDDADADGWGKVWNRLGRPEAPDGYGLDKLEGADSEFAKGAQATFHGLGLSQKQAEGLAKWYAETATGREQADNAAFAATAEREMAELETEWGGEHAGKMDLARRAARLAGLDGEALVKIERAVGTKALMTLFAGIGAKLGEDALPRDIANDPGSPAGATAEIDRKLSDAEFMRKVRSGDRAAREQLARLHQVAYPERKG